MFYPTFSSFVASLATSGPTMGRSLWPRLFRSGSQRSAPRLPTSHQAAPGRMVTSRASTHACEMNCSMVKSSTRCVRPKSSSKVGGDTSTQSGRMNRWTTSHQHRKCSCPPSLRGRLRYVDRLRRPRWRNGQLSTSIPPGPLDGGRSRLYTRHGVTDFIICLGYKGYMIKDHLHGADVTIDLADNKIEYH